MTMANINLESSLQELSTAISQNVETISKYLKENSVPQPSFDISSPNCLPLAMEVQVARQALLEDATKLLHLATGPEDFIKWTTLHLKHDNGVLSALNYFNFWDAVPVEGTISYSDLGQKVGLSESRTSRLLKHAYTMMIFYEPQKGFVAHTATSAVLVKNVDLRAWIGHNSDELLPPVANLNQALETYGDSSDPAESALYEAYGKTAFQFLDEDVGPKKGQEQGWRAKRFATCMKVINTSGSYSQHFIHEGLDWDGLGEATLVDIGGSTGHISSELARHYPKMKFIVQDLPSVESEFKRHLDPNLTSRLVFQSHDFFTPEPVKGADVYFLKHVLHDWADPTSIKILRNIVPAMTPKKSRIVIMDGVVPEYGEAPLALMKLSTSMDLQMMVALNARERTLDDWKMLFRQADSRFEFVNCVVPFGSAHGVLQFILDV